MADTINARVIKIDLAVTGVRTIRAIPTTVSANPITVTSVTVDGNPGVGGTIGLILRQGAAATGEIMWQFTGTASTLGHINDHAPFTTTEGLFLDDVAAAWDAGAVLLIYYK